LVVGKGFLPRAQGEDVPKDEPAEGDGGGEAEEFSSEIEGAFEAGEEESAFGFRHKGLVYTESQCPGFGWVSLGGRRDAERWRGV